MAATPDCPRQQPERVMYRGVREHHGGETGQRELAVHHYVMVRISMLDWRGGLLRVRYETELAHRLGRRGRGPLMAGRSAISGRSGVIRAAQGILF